MAAMNLRTRLSRAIDTLLHGTVERRDHETWDYLLASPSVAGVTVSPGNAETLVPLHAAVTAISEGMASMPLHLMARSDDGTSEKAREHSLYRLLHDAPNPMQNSYEWRRDKMGRVLLWGAAYDEIVTNAAGEITALLPIHPSHVTEEKLPDGRRRYRVSDPVTGEQRTLLDSEVFRVADREGKSRITTVRDAIGGAIAQQTQAARLAANGMRPNGILTAPGEVTQETVDRVRTAWQAKYGLGGEGGVAVLGDEMKFSPVSMSAVDAQFLESRKWSAAEIAALFRLHPSMLGDTSGTPYASAVEASRTFYVQTLRPWCECIEAAIEQQLLGPTQRRRYFVRHETSAMLRSDPKARAEVYRIALESGYATPNEIRALEDMPPIEGGDKLRPVRAAGGRPPEADAPPHAPRPSEDAA